MDLGCGYVNWKFRTVRGESIGVRTPGVDSEALEVLAMEAGGHYQILRSIPESTPVDITTVRVLCWGNFLQGTSFTMHG